jgi:ribosomal protein S3AE
MAEKKKFIQVKVPLISSSLRVLGTPQQIQNKTIKLDMTRKLRGKGFYITFRILSFEDSLIAVPSRFELLKSYVRKMMRKRTDYVEDSFKAQCKDANITIKPFLITRKKVSRAVRKNLRNTAKEFIIEYIKDKEFNDLCNELKTSVFQKEMLPKLKKVYPLSFCDIRVFEAKDLSKIDLKNASKGDEIPEEEIEQEVEEEKTTEEEGESEEEE